MQPAVYVDPSDITDRLGLMGLRESHLREAATQGYLFRTRLTAHHPRTFFGSVMWGETVASLRDQLRPLGWEPTDKGNYELTSHPQHGLAIAVAAGDGATGLEHATPSNKCPKGANTVEAIKTNRQMDMFAELLPKNLAESKGMETWVLLHHLSENELRLELSCPSEIGEDGKIKGWNERIILSPIPLGDDPLEPEVPQSEDIDIPVRRRAV